MKKSKSLKLSNLCDRKFPAKQNEELREVHENGISLECYSVTKRNELLIHTTWVNLTSIRLKERSYTQKSRQHIIPFI